jgi:hypothetical protein
VFTRAQCAPYDHFVRAEREKGEYVIKAAGIKMQWTKEIKTFYKQYDRIISHQTSHTL